MKNALKTVENEIVNEDFEYLPKFKNLPVSYQVTFDTYMQIVSYMKGKNVYDYIIVEMSSDIQPGKLKFMNECDKVVFVTTQDAVAVGQLETLIDSMSENSAEALIVCNRYMKGRQDYLKGSFLARHFEVVEQIDEYGKPLTYDNVKDSVLYKNLVSILE
jgi:MinD-like ATPase involved in chromosome partitioning or flagellar assembly